MKEVFFQGKFVPFNEAKIGVMTHAFNYGTGVFEGIRGYWNQKQGQMYVFKLKEHYERLLKSCRILLIEPKYSADELCKLTLELAKKNAYKEDVYFRPIAYKSSEKVGLGLLGIESDLVIYMTPFGSYFEGDKGLKACVSTWNRINDNMIPARAKITGVYVNSSLASAEAKMNGYDEAIMLANDGHVAEGPGENIFIVRGKDIITPPLHHDILEGITRSSLIELLEQELGMKVIERSMDRTELYISDEVFFSGTAAGVSPVTEIDKRKVGDGHVGPVTAKIKKLYFDVVKGDNPKYKNWLTPVFQ
jgi:branched-chain amino acid aminotransferase